jgi:hypothetical protein
MRVPSTSVLRQENGSMFPTSPELPNKSQIHHNAMQLAAFGIFGW